MDQSESTQQVNDRDRYFKGQQSNETFICFLRHHWIYILKDMIYFGAVTILVILSLLHIQDIQEILRGERELKMLFITGFGLSTFFLHRCFIKLLNFFVNTGIITDMRFIDHQKTLFFKDNMDSIDMSQIQNIERVGDGLLPNLLGYGDLKIFLSASGTIKTYECLSNVKFHFRCLSRLKEARQQMQGERTHLNIQELGSIVGEESLAAMNTGEQNAIPYESKENHPNVKA